MKHILILFIGLSSASVNAATTDSDESGLGYESIIGELEKQDIPLPVAGESEDPFDLAKIHLGFAMLSSYSNFQTANGKGESGLLTGFELSFGIDLFSPNWMALGSIRSYSSEKLGESLRAKLQEFDLKVFYKNYLSRRVQGVFGAGLSARYLDLKTEEAGMQKTTQYTTPASVLSAGFMARMGKQISIGPEFSYRSAMITETADKNAFDGMLKLDAQF